jgi:hypothetical protein
LLRQVNVYVGAAASKLLLVLATPVIAVAFYLAVAGFVNSSFL